MMFLSKIPIISSKTSIKFGFTLTILTLSVIAHSSPEQLNDRPIIGIYTNPSLYKAYSQTEFSSIAASYVQFVESAGAQAVQVPYDANEQLLDSLFNKINALVFPGGDVQLDSHHSVEKTFVKNAGYLLKKAKNATDNGDYFPVWGICQGFQLITYIESKMNKSVLTEGFNNTGNRLTSDINLESALFLNMPLNLIKWMETFKSVYYHHNIGVKKETFEDNPYLKDNLLVTSIGHNSSDASFVATYEHVSYPIYGTQFHPEKALFEWKIKAPHDYNSEMVSQYFGNFFGNQTRSNNHAFPSVEDEEKYLINQYKLRKFKSSTFQRVYILPNQDNPDVDYEDHAKKKKTTAMKPENIRKSISLRNHYNNQQEEEEEYEQEEQDQLIP